MVKEFGRDLDRHPVHYQDFKWSVVARLPGHEPWKLSSVNVRDAVGRIREEKKR